MVGRKMKSKDYKLFQDDLSKNAKSNPLSPIYEISITYNGENYSLFVQPEKNNCVYLLYATRSFYDENTKAINHIIVTDNRILLSLMEMTIYYSVKQAS